MLKKNPLRDTSTPKKSPAKLVIRQKNGGVIVISPTDVKSGETLRGLYVMDDYAELAIEIGQEKP